MHVQSSESWLPLLVVLFVSTGNTAEGSIFHVSRWSGKDTSTCGTLAAPCKTIAMAVNQSESWGDLIYIDGSGTEHDPYPCKSMTSQHPGIYVDKSVSLIGYNTPVYFECNEGLSLMFEADEQTKMVTIIKISRIQFVKSSLRFTDCWAEIDSCVFIGGGPHPISVSQELRSLKLTILNCECVNTSACFGVEQKVQKDLVIDVANTQVTGMQGTYIASQTSIGAALYINSQVTHNATDTPNTDVRLKNVTFADCSFGSPYGLLYFAGITGITTITLNGTTFTRIRPSDHGSYDSGIVQIVRTNTVSLVMNGVSFIANNYQRCLCLNNRGAIIHVQMLNSQFIETGKTGRPQVGAVLYLPESSTLTLDVKGSRFYKNNAVFGGCFYVFARKTLLATIEDSVFAATSATAHYGVFYFSAPALTVTMLNSTFTDNTAVGLGGVMYCVGPTILLVNNSQFTGNSAGTFGGVIALRGNPVQIMIMNTVFINNHAKGGPGGAVYIDSS